MSESVIVMEDFRSLFFYDEGDFFNEVYINQEPARQYSPTTTEKSYRDDGLKKITGHEIKRGRVIFMMQWENYGRITEESIETAFAHKNDLRIYLDMLNIWYKRRFNLLIKRFPAIHTVYYEQ